MKELTTYNRVPGYLNKMFDQLNAEFFESALTKILRGSASAARQALNLERLVRFQAPQPEFQGKEEFFRLRLSPPECPPL